jgi:hypothetical protein
MARSYCARARLSRAVVSAACASSRSVVVAVPACTSAWVTRYASSAEAMAVCDTSTATAAAFDCDRLVVTSVDTFSAWLCWSNAAACARCAADCA